MYVQSLRKRALRLETLEGRFTPTTLPPGFAQVAVTSKTTLVSPTAMEIAPDGQLWMLEQGGKVKMIRPDGTARTALTKSVNFVGERGLLGIAFDPSYDGAGPNADHVFLYYTAPRLNAANPAHNRISRFNVVGAGTANPTLNGEVVIRDLPPEAEDGDTNHNGGAIHFGPDGKLFVAVGDHNYDTTPQSAHVSQILTTPFGKMLRLNPDGTNPADNPFYAGSTTDWPGAIWALGLRNPYTFAFEPNSTRMFINDVGESSWEEINKGEAGANYGWAGSTNPLWEGFESPPPSWANYRDPQMAYDHDSSPPSPAGVAITGGVFYPANSSFGSAYAGKYFFADYGANFIRVFDPANPGSNATPDTSSDFASDVTGGAPVDLKVDASGRLYYLARGAGKVYRIDALIPAILKPPVNTFVGLGRSGGLSVQASGAVTLLYQWQKFNGASWDPINGATSATLTIDSAAAGDAGQYRVVVTNNSGTVTSDPASITIDQVPTGSITAPNSYIFNDIITFSGTGTDPEDGALSASAFSWHVDYHHDGMIQPHVAEFSGFTSGMFTASAAATDPGQFYRIVLTVTDSHGIATTITRDVFPDTATLTVASQPGGLPLTLDGQPVTGSVNSVIGIARTLSAPLTMTLGDFPYRFTGWSDGGAATHVITTPLFATSYVASYARVTPGLKAEFFDLNTSLDALPDLTALTADVSRTDATMSYPSTTAPWAGLGAGFADTFAARHNGLVRVDKFGRYTFSLKSGDGSKLWLDGELIVDNDGIHGMLEKSATRTLEPGYHVIRVEMFENSGTAGLVLSWAGPGFLKQVIPAARLFHDVPSGASVFKQESGPDGLVVLEAEDHDGIVARKGLSWQPSASGTGYSGVGVMREVPNAGIAYNTNFMVRSPRLDYSVNFLQAGTYYVWTRGKGATATDDSLHVGLDGVASPTADRIFGLKPAYNWTNATADKAVATIDVPTPGVHTVNVWMWEDGVVLDRLLLTTSASFLPTGLGPPESTRSAASVDNSLGFSGSTGLQLNGSAGVVGSGARLTSSLNNQAGSLFSSNKVDVSGFATTFDFRLTSAAADGFAFVIQGNASTALGSDGEGLGYQGIGNSLAIKFDLFDNAGEGGNSTGLYTNGQSPSSGGTDLTPSGIDLHSGHDFRVAISYVGGTLNIDVTDLMTGAKANQSYIANVTGLVGGNTAFVGFTGGTSSSSATQDILNWTYWN